MDLSTSNWRILRVHSGSEVAIASSLRFPSYVPHCRQSKYNRKQRVTLHRVVPLLPGFVFVHSDPALSLRAIAPSPHVIGFMREPSREYSELTPRSFALLREVEHRALLAPFTTPVEELIEAPVLPALPAFTPGDLVSVRSLSTRAIIDSLHGDRIIARMLGTNFRLDLKIEDAELIAA